MLNYGSEPIGKSLGMDQELTRHFISASEKAIVNIYIAVACIF